MKTKHYLMAGALVLALGGFLFSSCEKKSPTTSNNNNNNTTDITPAQDDANGQFAIQDSKNIADGAAKSQAVERLMGAPCATFTYENHSGKFDTVVGGQNDSAIWVNFGNTPCKCTDGNYRKGQLFVYWTRTFNYFDTSGGATIGLVFNNYFFNDTNIAGSRTLTNNNGHSWTFTANINITYPRNGGIATWNTTRTVAYTVTNSVAYWQISGNASGTSRTGKTFSLTVNQPLYVTVWPWWLGGCPWIESGYLTITVTGLQYPLAVNFGSASKLGSNDCHLSDTVIYNNVKYPFIQ